MIEITINSNQADKRLDKVLQKHLAGAQTSFIYKMLRKKNITLNKKKADGTEKTILGDTVQFFFSEETYLKMRGETGEDSKSACMGFKRPSDFPKIQVLYEDQDVCVFVKPQGILSQKAEENDYSVNEWVVEEALEKGYIKDSDLKEFRPSVCNRLDRNTSGIMVAGFSTHGLQVLSQILKDRTAEKCYVTLVKGQVFVYNSVINYLLKNSTTNQVTIYDHEVQGSKKIHTSFEPLKVLKEQDMTLLKVYLHTGRSHQIRAQLAYLGHPILGDTKYGDKKFNEKYHFHEQCLCAYHLEFPACDLPGVSNKTFEINVPKDWPI